MNEILELFTKNEVTNVGIIFLMLASCFVALFHTVIFSGLFNFNFNGWLFFILNPLLILIVGLISKNLVFLVFFLLFISVFILAIIGMIYAGITAAKEDKQKQKQFNKKYNVAPEPLWKKIAGYFMIALFIGAFFYIGFYAIFFLFFAIPVLQNILPTKKIDF